MSKPLIIFGAGASFDCRGPINPINDAYKPPLTHELFDGRFSHLMGKFSGSISELAADVNAFVRSKQFTEGKKSIEGHYQDVIDHGKFNKSRLNQLIDFRYYLQYLFAQISQVYTRPDNSYRALKVVVDDNCDEAYYVTFDYDKLLDECFGRFSTIDGYIAGSNKLIKLHGSCNWFYQLPDEVIREITSDGYKSVYQYLLENPEKIGQLISKNQPVSHKKLNADSTLNLFNSQIPSLAIPVPETKTFVCPESHINALREGLKRIDRILLIGWKGADTQLMDLLKKELPQIDSDFPVLVVSSDQESASEIVRRLFPKNRNAKPSACKGFYEFTGYSDDLDFLKDTVKEAPSV